jgi:hypothetical protein
MSTENSNKKDTSNELYTLLCAAGFKQMLIERMKGNKPKELRDIRVEAKKLFNELGLGSGSTEQTGSDVAEILVTMPTIRFNITLEDVL